MSPITHQVGNVALNESGTMVHGDDLFSILECTRCCPRAAEALTELFSGEDPEEPSQGLTEPPETKTWVTEASLTPEERNLIETLGKAASEWKEIVPDYLLGGSETALYDTLEFYAKIHDLQRTVMAQAAARAYPERYRMLGEDLPRQNKEDV